MPKPLAMLSAYSLEIWDSDSPTRHLCSSPDAGTKDCKPGTTASETRDLFKIRSHGHRSLDSELAQTLSLSSKNLELTSSSTFEFKLRDLSLSLRISDWSNNSQWRLLHDMWAKLCTLKVIALQDVTWQVFCIEKSLHTRFYGFHCTSVSSEYCYPQNGSVSESADYHSITEHFIDLAAGRGGFPSYCWSQVENLSSFTFSLPIGEDWCWAIDGS